MLILVTHHNTKWLPPAVINIEQRRIKLTCICSYQYGRERKILMISLKLEMPLACPASPVFCWLFLFSVVGGRCRMSINDGLIAFLTILISLLLVVVVVGTAWWLMWKVRSKNNTIFNKILQISPTWKIRQVWYTMVHGTYLIWYVAKLVWFIFWWHAMQNDILYHIPCVVWGSTVLVFQLFLSRFQFINEILFPPTEEKQKTLSKRKVRKDWVVVREDEWQ